LSFPVTLGSPVQSSRWQAVFTDRTTEQFTGARIVELDGFGSLADPPGGVPEPTSAALAISGLAALVFAAKRQSRNKEI
jgi:hypothetical protein